MLNEKFKERMSALLGKEYDAFITALEDEDAVRAFRINRLKAENVTLPYEITPIPYESDGYILSDGDGIGNTPEHHAGMIYVQDPGAMAALSALEIKEGWRIADLCAAPGGKSTQAASRLSGTGFLLSNEYVPKRAKILVGNFERLGIRNAVVTSLDTSVLSDMYEGYFDLVIVDAPCSGEGMFRKSSEALAEWSEENVMACHKRQTEILRNARSLVRGGGYLLYSTCTYSLLENEMTVDEFLSENPDFTLTPVREELISATADGISFDGCRCENMRYTRRFYPHLSRGEGQFVALMRRESDIHERCGFKDASLPLKKEEERIVMKFLSDTLIAIPEGRIRKVGDNIVLISHNEPIPQRSVFSSGVLIGRIEKGLLFPEHQFFSAYGTMFKNKLNLTRGDGRTEKYLRGEEIDATGLDGTGYAAILYEGAPLGGGKASGGRIKNHYPKGLRLK